ncbi:unnamed protein product [Malus baccata var. baccata]
MTTPVRNETKKQENQKAYCNGIDDNPVNDLWTNGIIYAFEFVRGHKKALSSPVVKDVAKKQVSKKPVFSHELSNSLQPRMNKNNSPRTLIQAVWDRISELVQTVQVDACWEDDDDVTVADVAAPYWERPVGPTWWCHVDVGHPYINSIALRDDSKLINERMKHLLYEVPVRVACGLLFELLGQSAGDPLVNEDDIPVVLRSWQSQNFLVTALHVKCSAQNVNVLGISKVQELLVDEGISMPWNIHEVIAHLACRFACWDDRLYRKFIFGAADEVELKFMNMCFNPPVIRVKWSLHVREEIMFEFLYHLREDTTKGLLEGVRKSTREMIQEQEVVRGRLFTIQDVMQSTVRAWLQDRSLTMTHNLGVFGGCSLLLSIITSLFGINVDGIPGNEGSPYAFALFSAILVLLGVMLIGIGLVYLGLKKPIVEEDVEVRKLELQELVKMFQQEAESHVQVRRTVPRTNPTAAGRFPESATCYVLIS